MEVSDDIKNFLATIKTTPQRIIPINGFVGDNVTEYSKNLSWYASETLIDTLDKISGDKIKIFHEGRETTVIEFAHWQERDKKISAEAGENVGIIVADEFFNRRGEIITLANDVSPKVSNRLRASVFWLGKNFLTVGKSYKLKLATALFLTLKLLKLTKRFSPTAN